MEEQEQMQPKQLRDRQQALDELHRELGIRKRCFRRWIADGRVSATDAQDRIDRLATAIELITGQSSEVQQSAVPS